MLAAYDVTPMPDYYTVPPKVSKKCIDGSCCILLRLSASLTYQPHATSTQHNPDLTLNNLILIYCNTTLT